MTEPEGDALVLYQTPLPGVARIVLNRPGQRNAQDFPLLYALNDAFDRAVADEGIRCIILAGNGKDFSAGHDLKGAGMAVGKDRPAVGVWGGFDEGGAHGWYAAEQEVYLGLTRRWRNAAKPTIAAVQGNCFGAGLALAWACDIILAAENACFADPVVTFGMMGIEWFAHPWELGPRKAKEHLFTSDSWDAQEAWRLGMVNHVVATEGLDDFALAMAQKIAAKPAFALKTAKEAVNRCVDMGQQSAAIDAVFPLHHLCHQHNNLLFGQLMDPTNAPAFLAKPRARD